MRRKPRTEPEVVLTSQAKQRKRGPQRRLRRSSQWDEKTKGGAHHGAQGSRLLQRGRNGQQHQMLLKVQEDNKGGDSEKCDFVRIKKWQHLWRVLGSGEIHVIWNVHAYHRRRERLNWVWMLLEKEGIYLFSGQLKSPVSSDGKEGRYR